MNTTLGDSGKYTCKVSDYQEHHNNKSIKVKIFGKYNNKRFLAYYLQTFKKIIYQTYNSSEKNTHGRDVLRQVIH